MKIIEDFKLYQKVSDEIITEYEGILPTDILDFWKSYGFGVFFNGYLRSVNPNEYKDLLHESVNGAFHEGVVLFTTGMSDLIIWCDGYLRICNYRYNIMDTLITTLTLFFRCLESEMFTRDKLCMPPYLEAVQKHGELEFDEAFGYVPLLALGGNESVNHLDKVKIREHILICSSLVGKIAY